MAAASTPQHFMDLAEQLLSGPQTPPGGGMSVFPELMGDVFPKFLRESPHQHPDDGSCTFCSDDTFWQLLEEPAWLQSPCSIQETATILARLATELINNSHSPRAFQAVTRAFSR